MTPPRSADVHVGNPPPPSSSVPFQPGAPTDYDITLVNLSDSPVSWTWLEPVAPELAARWVHCHSRALRGPAWLPHSAGLGRARAASQATRALLRDPRSLLVSHGPWLTTHASIAMAMRGTRRRHLAYAFSFGELPQGVRRRVVARALRSVDRFVSFSSIEKAMYARYFDLDPSRFGMHLWAARPPEVESAATPLVPGRYLCALGSQGRDYAPLVAAMRQRPGLRLVIVASPASRGLQDLPNNVDLRFGIPRGQAMNILLHSRYTAIALRGADIPCGHGSIVAAMHLGKAIACTDSSGVSDYIDDGRTGLLVPPDDAAGWLNAIDRLEDDDIERTSLGVRAREFAAQHCSEAVAVAYLRSYLSTAIRPAHAGPLPAATGTSP